ncbi:hypothetical protein OUZ56_027638 [Daphnia magna]|uniref:Uncharacterized protein n=1 Tax=Daphnia magna TaxID=35525 RepID=A0ABR0B1H4_9CRUS|nr:hypothetical protein OUZ56_027638 [Daphnia magna]
MDANGVVSSSVTSLPVPYGGLMASLKRINSCLFFFCSAESMRSTRMSFIVRRQQSRRAFCNGGGTAPPSTFAREQPGPILLKPFGSQLAVVDERLMITIGHCERRVRNHTPLSPPVYDLCRGRSIERRLAFENLWPAQRVLFLVEASALELFFLFKLGDRVPNGVVFDN